MEKTLNNRIISSDKLDSLEPIFENPDVLIVGSGPAGATAAKLLCEKGYSILVLEAGHYLPNTNSEEFIELPDNIRKKDWTFGLSWQYGGASNLWAGRCAPLEKSDISSEKGWPFSSDDFYKYYVRAASLIGLTPISEINQISMGSNFSPEWKSFLKDISVKRFQWNKPCFNSGSLLTSVVKENDNIAIVLSCRFLKFNQNDNCSKITSAQIALSNGKIARITSKIYILATGGIETPRILLNSTEFDPCGIGNKSGTVGRYFSTHPKCNVATLHLLKPVKINSPFFSDTKIDSTNVRFGVGCIPSSNQLNHYVQFSPNFEKYGAKLLQHLQYSTELILNQQSPSKYHLTNRFIGTVRAGVILAGRILFNIVGKIGLFQNKTTILSVKGFFDQYPNYENKIELSPKTDSFGMRKAKISWQFSEEDIQSVKSFVNNLAQLANRANLGKFKIDLPDKLTDWGLTSIHSHFMGTTRMGNDPKLSVTDSYGKLHDADNVFISGSALFPSYGYANPVLTICALAIRVAEGVDNSLMKEKENG